MGGGVGLQIGNWMGGLEKECERGKANSYIMGKHRFTLGSRIARIFAQRNWISCLQ